MFPPLEAPKMSSSLRKMDKSNAFLSSTISKHSSDYETKLKQGQSEEALQNIKENAVQRARREAKEREGRARKALEAKSLYESRRARDIREKELRHKRRRLTSKISARPQDKKSALSLIDVAYELEDYYQVCTVIKRSILKFEELRTFDIYLKLGRCYLRRWKKDGSKSDLMSAYEAYKEALNDPNTLLRPLASPFAYFEFVGVCIRLEKAQIALDILGAAMLRWSENYELVLLCQYIIGQVSFSLGKVDSAYEIYKEIVLCPHTVEPFMKFDASEQAHSIPMVSQYLTSILCQIELSCIQRRLGDTKLSVRMFAEAFSRQNKVGPVTLEDGTVIDIRNGHTEFNSWAGSHETFKFLGDLLRLKMNNLSLAAELYGLASEVYSRNIDDDVKRLSKREKSYFCGLILDRGESLAEIGAHEGAEFCGHYAFKLMPIDPVVTGRSARCCQRINEMNNEITLTAVGVFKAVNLMQRILRRKVAYRRKLARLALNDYATVINSAIRMALVRNRFAGDFLEVTRSDKIAARIHSFRGLWKSGQQELKQWVEFWNVSCNIIQRGLWRWFIRRKNSRVVRGITSCKRIWRGQHARWKLRDQISRIQEKLESGISCERGEYGLYFDSFLVQRLTTGITVVTNDQNEVPTSPKLNAMEEMKMNTSGQLLDQFLPKNIASPSKVYASDYVLGLKSRPSRRVVSLESVADAGLSLFKSSNFDSPPPSNAVSQQELLFPIGSNSAPGSLQKYAKPVGLTIDSITSSETIYGEKSSALVSVEVLDTYVQMAEKSGEDVLSMVSVKNTLEDKAYKWVPFAILPEEAVVRLLTCTILSITSTSFTVQDSMRIVYVCKKYPHLWNNLKSLIILGTKLGMHGTGITNLINLGLDDLSSLSIGYTNIPSSFGHFLGSKLMDLKANTKPSSLTKLYIDNEPRFGVRGAVDLTKALQFNSSLRILSLRRCGLSKNAVTSLSRLVSLSKNLEILNVNDNYFSYSDCRQLLHAVANKGVKGNFRGLHCIGTLPPLKPSELESLFKEGIKINVNVISGELGQGGLGFHKELSFQKDLEEMSGNDLDQKKIQTVDLYANEIQRVTAISDWEKVSMEGTKAYKAIYF